MPIEDPKKATPIYELTFEGGDWPTSVAFVGSQRRVVAGNRLGEIYLWELPEQAPEKLEKKEEERDKTYVYNPPVRKLVGHTNAISHLVVLPDGKTVVSASLDHTIRFWDTSVPATGKENCVLDMQQRRQVAKRKRDEAIPHEPGLDIDTQEAAHVLSEHEHWIKALDLSHDGRRLISGDDGCRTIVWDVQQRKEIARWSGKSFNWVSSAALSADGEKAFVAEYCASRGSFDRPAAQVKIFEAASGKEILDILKVQFPDVKERDNSYGYHRTWGKFVGRGLVAAQFSPDGKILAVGMGGEGGDGKVHLLDAATGKTIKSPTQHRYGVTDLAFTKDGRYLLSTGRDTQLNITDVAAKKEVVTHGKKRGGQFSDWWHAVDLSPDENWFAVADIAGQVQLWRFG